MEKEDNGLFSILLGVGVGMVLGLFLFTRMRISAMQDEDEHIVTSYGKKLYVTRETSTKGTVETEQEHA